MARFRTPLHRVRGLGAAGGAADHWWVQRLTAVALVPLSLIFVAYALSLVGAGHATVVETLGRPVPATLTLLLIVALFWHLKLGAQVIVEDYVHHEGLKFASIIVLTFACIALGLACALAVLRLLLGA